MKFLNKEEIQDLSIEEFLQRYGVYVDSTRLSKDEAGCKHAIIIGQEALARYDLRPLDIAQLHYMIGNAWGELVGMREPSSHWNWQGEEAEKEIYHFRSAFSSSGFSELNSTWQGSILSNLSNSLDFVGRSFESLRWLYKGYEVIPNYGMVIALLGRHAWLMRKKLPSITHQMEYDLFAFDQLTIAINRPNGIHPNDQPSFIEALTEISGRVDIGTIRELLETRFSAYRAKPISRYKTWCFENTLCLCPLNDIRTNRTHFCECYRGFSDQLKDKIEPWLTRLYEQITTEFKFARYLAFTGSQSWAEATLSTGDTRESLLDAGENLKTSFRLMYSLFDKIAYFICGILNVKMRQRDVNFKSLWYEDQSNFILRKEFDGRRNLHLMGLYFITKDIFRYRWGFREAIEPDAKQLDDLRNALEHRAVRLVLAYDDVGHSGHSKQRSEKEYEISYSDIHAKTLKMAFYLRCSIMYLYQAVHQEHTDAESLAKLK